MIVSMTGFGQAERTIDGYMVRAEARSVNHRYLEAAVKLPRNMARFEDVLKRIVQGRLKRGRVELFVALERQEEAAGAMRVNWAVAEGYWTASKAIADRYGIPNTMQVADLLQIDGVLVHEQLPAADDDMLAEALQACATEALDGLLEMRRREGSHLQADLLTRLEEVERRRNHIVTICRDAVEENKRKLRQRISELLDDPGTLDEQRLHTEVAVMAERMDVQEELTRLASHFKQFRTMLGQTEPVGRKLDFLVQEMNREANTIGSKANHAGITASIVDLKAELEKIREQVQNIQ
mgnify:CR=1 FL=1